MFRTFSNFVHVAWFPERLLKRPKPFRSQARAIMKSLFRLFLHRRAFSRTLLISCLAVTWVSSLSQTLRNGLAEHIEDPCPPCELLFGKLEKTGRDGKLSQEVRVQERGEPKSGTGFMYFWASATLLHTCGYLKGLFGEETWSLK